MAVTGWILVQTEVGRARAVSDAIAAISMPGIKVLATDTVTGQYDVIARVEAEDTDALLSAVESAVAAEGGVQDVVTCLAIHLA